MHVRVSGLKKNNDQYIQTNRLGKITRKISLNFPLQVPAHGINAYIHMETNFYEEELNHGRKEDARTEHG